MRNFLILLFWVFSFMGHAQTDSIDTGQELLGDGINYGKDEDNRPPKVKQQDTFIVVADMPEFIGGQDSMMKYIYKNLVYPPQAKENGVEGTIRFKFIVTATGEIINPKIISKEKLGYGCEEAAMAVIMKMPKWKPGREKNIPVAVYYYNLPIRFRLE